PRLRKPPIDDVLGLRRGDRLRPFCFCGQSRRRPFVLGKRVRCDAQRGQYERERTSTKCTGVHGLVTPSAEARTPELVPSPYRTTLGSSEPVFIVGDGEAGCDCSPRTSAPSSPGVTPGVGARRTTLSDGRPAAAAGLSSATATSG